MYFPVVGYAPNPTASCAVGTTSAFKGHEFVLAANDILLAVQTSSFFATPSTDGGLTWGAAVGFDNPNANGGLTFTAAGNDFYVWGTSAQFPFECLWLSSDGGLSFDNGQAVTIDGVGGFPFVNPYYTGAGFVSALSVAVGPAISSINFLLSSNGTAWTTNPVTVTGDAATDGLFISSIRAGNGQLVATCFAASGKNYCFVSDDLGATWTQVSLPTTARWVDSVWNGTKWVMVGFAASPGVNLGVCVNTADPFGTWVQRTMASSRNWERVISFSNGILLAFAESDAGANTNIMNMSDTNGDSWISCTLPVSRQATDAVIIDDTTALLAVVGAPGALNIRLVYSFGE